MRLFKNHFAVVFPLFVLLCSIQFIVFTHKVIVEYESFLTDDYSIIVVANDSLDKAKILKTHTVIKSIEALDADAVLNRLKDDISLQNMELLQKSLPKFYTLKLNRFPSKSISDTLRKELLGYESIVKVEFFAKTYNKIYYVLKLLNSIVLIFTLFITVTSLLLIVKQMRIWTYEHQERMFVMNLFGASFWTKSVILYRLAIIDSFLSAGLTSFLFLLIDKLPFVADIFAQLGIQIPPFHIYSEGAILLGIALFISVLSTTLAMIRVKQV